MIVDTNALSAFADGDAAIGAVLREQRRVFIPAIVLGEFRFGIATLGDGIVAVSPGRAQSVTALDLNPSAVYASPNFF